MKRRLKKEAFGDSKFTVWTSHDLDAQEDSIGLPGSPTRVSGLEQAPTRDRKRIIVDGSSREIANQLSKIIKNSL